MDDNDLLFNDDDSQAAEIIQEKHDKPWKILLVDDEEEIHKVTKLVLGKMLFDKKPVAFIHAYSAKQAKQLLSAHSDIAMALIDVVMETDHAGLDLIDWIRNDLSNKTIRLVLRTGQPGQAPEHQVIENYDINDYKDKTELTDIKMKTMTYAALRSYQDLMTIERARKGMERVLESTATIYRSFCLNSFATAILEQINNILDHSHESLYATPTKATMAASSHADVTHYEIIASSGELSNLDEGGAETSIPKEIREGFDATHKAQKSLYINNRFFGYFVTEKGNEHLLYVCPINDLSEFDLHLLGIYAHNVGIALDNRNLQKEIETTQREFIYRLGEAVEKRSNETGGHVKRVAKISELLAIKFGATDGYVTNLKLAAPLHDVGKVGIPDAVLNKPGPLTDEEWAVMKTHSQLGHDILANSDKPILQMAANIAIEHHENWDGSGYPKGLSKKEISLEGRIVALADVFDALGNKRCYKEPWPPEDVIKEILSLSGIKFDPELVTIIQDNAEEFFHFRDIYPD